MTDVHVHFEHGLGDSANFARMIPLYTRRGYRVRVSTTPDKAWLFRAVGAEVTDERGETHPWNYSGVGTVWTALDNWQGNKNGGNISQPPMPDIGSRDDLWAEYCAPLSIEDAISTEAMSRVASAVSGLPRPLILLHTIGNTNSTVKSLLEEQHFSLYRELLDSGGTVVLLDYDERVPVFPHYRLRLLFDVLPRPDANRIVEELVALMAASDLVIGVDSGPLHLAGLTSTPRVGLFRDAHYPSTYLLPRGCPPKDDMSLVGTSWQDWTVTKRIPFGIVETDWSAKDVSRLCLEMIDGDPFGPRIRTFLSLCRGIGANGEYADRHKSFRAILDLAKIGTWIETGTIRQAEDWPGAGYSTYLFGAMLHAGTDLWPAARLYSIDSDPANCAFARKQTAVFAPHVDVVESRGDDFLRSFEGSIDLLYLDSCDTTIPEHAQVCLDELKAGLPKMTAQGIIAIDDTPWDRGKFTGKGELAVPYLLDLGWRIVFAGYQVVLARN